MKKSMRLPRYKKDKQMFLGCFSSPFNNDKAYREYAGCGYNAVLIDQNYGPMGSPAYKEILGFCEKYGLKAIPMSFGEDFPHAGDCTDYMAYPMFDGVCFWDEPLYWDYDKISSWIEGFERKYPGKTFYVNIAPNYWDEKLGEMFSDGYTRLRQYISAYCEKILNKLSGKRQFSMDLYPLDVQGGRNVLRKEWLKHLEVCGEFVKDSGYEFHFFIQTTGGWEYDPGNPDKRNSRAPECIEDLRVQCYVDMAYGVNAFSHFTYNSQLKFRDSAVATKDGPTHRYAFVKEMNRELTAFAHVFLSFSWKGAQAVQGREGSDYAVESFSMLTNSLKELAAVKEIEAHYDAVIGEFMDGKGNYGYILANYTEPSEKKTNAVKLHFKNAASALIYREGRRAAAEIRDNTLELKLKPGGGVFIIPLNN